MTTEASCIFCRIGKGEIPSEFLYRDERVFAIKDIHPRAPVHLLIIPFSHIGMLTDHAPQELYPLGAMLAAASALAKQLKLSDGGYRLIINQGAHAGQEVAHLHMHLLAGRQLGSMG